MTRTTSMTSSEPRPATGDQFSIRRGDARALIGAVGAVLRGFWMDGTAYTETWSDSQAPPMGCGLALVPWPNRVADARWVHEGVDRQLDITEPARGNAIHGLLRYTEYTPLSVSEDSVTLAATAYPQHGWPFTLDVRLTYAVGDAGLRVTFAVANAGAEWAVFGCGSHPYLRIGEVPSGDCTLTVRAGSFVTTDDAMIPTGTVPLTDPRAGDLSALPSGVRLAGRDWDIGLADLEPTATAGTDVRAAQAGDPGRAGASIRDTAMGHSGGQYEHTLTAPGGHGVTLWADPAFAWAQVYTPQDFPAADGPRPAVAVEPMTCPANALNSGDGLIRLDPGEAWAASWGLAPF